MNNLDIAIVAEMPESGRLARIFVELSQYLTSGRDNYEVLTMLSASCVEILPVKASGILITDQSGILQVIASSSPSAHLLDLYQVQNEEGPCFECCKTGTAIADTELSANGPWPRFAAIAKNRGFSAAYALPLKSKDVVLGALNLFAQAPLSAERLLIAQALADAAAFALLRIDPVSELELVARRIFMTIEERNIVEQAKGMISQRFETDPDLALDKIKFASLQTSLTIVEVSRAVINRDHSHPAAVFLTAEVIS